MRTLFLLLLALGSARADYSFVFVCRDDTVAQVAPGDPAYFRFALTNTGQSDDVYEFDCRVRQSVSGWAIAYCLGGRCVEPGTVMFDSLAAGATDTTPVIDVYTGASAGEAVIELHVRSQGNRSLADSITVHALAGVGIEDSPRAPVRARPVVPNPVRPGSILRVGESGRVRMWRADGRPVGGGVAAGGKWSIPEWTRPGVYVVAAGDRRFRVVVE